MTPRTSTRARTRTGLRAGAVVGVVALALGVSACSAAGDPRAAAVVDGRVVAEADVQAVVRELPPEITDGAQVDPVQILSLLIASDVVEGVARDLSEGPVSLLAGDEDAQAFLDSVDAEAGREPQEYSDATLRVIATNQMVNALQQTDAAAPLLQEGIVALQDADITLNPRYGTVGEDGELQYGVYEHDWLVQPVADEQALPEG